MGFKLKKKNTGESGAAHSSNAFLTKIQTQVEDFARLFGDSSKSAVHSCRFQFIDYAFPPVALSFPLREIWANFDT